MGGFTLGGVKGPASSTDNAVTRFDGTTGQVLQNSPVAVSDTGAVSGVTDLSLTGAVSLSNGQGTLGQVPISQGPNTPVIWGAGGGGGGGTVTSVATAGTVSGITLTGGPITGSGTITLGGALNLSAPPAIGGTTANTGAFTTLTASTSLTTSTVQASNSGGLALKNAGGTTQISMGGGGGDNLSINVSTNINGANAAISISPTGTGSVVINPATAGTINNMVIGGTTPNAVSATNLGVSGAITLSNGQGTSGQILSSKGPGQPVIWIDAPSGGGGGAFSSQVEWSTNSSSKNAYIDQSAGTINNQGIDIKLTASSGSGNLTNVTVILNGVALTNTYASTGTFPNYTITVPVGGITGVAAQTTASVSVACSGTYNGGNFNVANAGTLTNVQPIAFTTTLSGVYSPATLPFYTATSAINYSYTNSGAITAFNGVITPTGGTAQNATAASGTFASQPIAGAAISGNATGTGQFGAGSSTVTLSGSIPAVSVYTPAFYVQTANSTPPTITTSSTQTAGAAQGSTVTYPTATASTQYNWICTQRPLANIAVVTPFGNAPLVPNVTAPTQTISGQTFNVYGVTGLDTLNPVQLVIS